MKTSLSGTSVTVKIKVSHRGFLSRKDGSINFGRWCWLRINVYAECAIWVISAHRTYHSIGVD